MRCSTIFFKLVCISRYMNDFYHIVESFAFFSSVCLKAWNEKMAKLENN